MIYDPWNESQDFTLELLNDEKVFFIKGPMKNLTKKTNISNNNKVIIQRFDIEFIITHKNDNIYISTKERGFSGYKIIEIIIKKDKNKNDIYIGHLENVSKYDKYSGSDLMLLALQILYRLHVKKCTLIDVSYFECSRNNFFKQREIPLKIIKLLKSNNTFYSPFNFQALDKTSQKNRMEDLRKLVENLYQIKWSEIDIIIIAGKRQIEIMNEISNNSIMDYNRLELRNINKWKKYWNTIYKSWNIFKNKFGSAMTPFRAFKFFDEKENCSDFIDWLELYSFTFFNFNKIIYYKFLNQKYEIPKIKIFNQLKEILNNVIWTNNKIVAQSDTFIVEYF